jgi:hypothetical protein
MSPIGRVFIVLNLLLAGAFVAFAGTHLRNSTHWKVKHEEDVGKLTREKEDLSNALNAAQQKNGANELRVMQLDQLQKSTKNQLDEAMADALKLREQLNSIEGTIKQIESSNRTVADQLKLAVERADAAYKGQMEASQREHDAKDAQSKAEATLAEAQSKIGDLETKLADGATRIQGLEADVAEKDLLIAAVKTKVPGVLLTAVPDIHGNVTNVDPGGQLVTVEVTSKTGEIKPGYSLAIFSGSTYKGDMVVTSVEGNYVFGRMSVVRDGSMVAPGDKAASNLGN